MNKGTKKKYNELSFESLPDYVQGDSIRVKFDGFVSDYIFDIAGLKASTIKDGIYPIIICSCGMIGCGGAYVLTRKDGNDIYWEQFWDGMSCGKPDKECEYTEFDLIFPYDKENEHKVIIPPLIFRLSEYRKLADDLEMESNKLYGNQKQFQERLDRYLSGDNFVE